MAAAVSSGKTRFAWRASNDAAATVHRSVRTSVLLVYTSSHRIGSAASAPLASPARASTMPPPAIPSTPTNRAVRPSRDIAAV